MFYLFTFNPHFQRHFTATGNTSKGHLHPPYLSILIFRGTSLQHGQRGGIHLLSLSFNPHFQRHFTATYPNRGTEEGLRRFQSSFSEALYCYSAFGPERLTWWVPFNPHFQRLFTATKKVANFRKAWREAFNPHFQRLFTATQRAAQDPEPRGGLSILIFRGSLLLRAPEGPEASPAVYFQSSFSEALYCYSEQVCLVSCPPPPFNPHFQRLFTATPMLGRVSRRLAIFQSSFSEALYCYIRWTVVTDEELDFQSSFSEALYCYLLAPPEHGKSELLFQSSFSEALYCYNTSSALCWRTSCPFNPHFQRLFTATVLCER